MTAGSQINSRPTKPRRAAPSHFAIAVLGLAACLFGVWTAGREGLSRWFAESAKNKSLLAAADKAIRLSPSDPGAYYDRAFVLSSMWRPSDAAKDLERAVALQPSDYALCLALGIARDQSGDQEGALAAFNEAVRLAPYYAEPRWYLGKRLLQSGRRDEAFEELRRAGASQPSLMTKVIALAWEAYGGDAPAVQQVLQPQTAQARLELAHFFIKQGSIPEALDLFRGAGGSFDEDRKRLLTELLAVKQYAEAYEVWSSAHPAASAEHYNGIATIFDGGFEGSIIVDDPGFGWQLARDLPAVRLSQDPNEPRAGAYSLRAEFNGNSDPNSPITSHLVLVEPSTRYRLDFAARTQEVVTGGSPVVAVADADSSGGGTLAQSSPLPQGTTGWRDYTMEFTTSSVTRALLITVRRRQCTSGPCPIFGRVWFDDFSLRKL